MQTHTTPPALRSTLPSELDGRAPLTFRGEPVLTTELAAKAFGATEAQLRQNYAGNADRFEAGKHFHKVDGDELRALKNRVDFIDSVGRNARSVTLWTERGIARHAKMLETETAWAIFESLEDTYFRVKAEKVSVAPVTSPIRRASASELRLSHEYWHRFALGQGLDPNQAAISTNRIVRRVTGVDVMEEMQVKALPAPTNEVMLIPSEIGERLGGLKAQAINKKLIAGEYQTTYRVKNRLRYELTEKGKAAGGRMFDTERRHTDGTIVPQIKWPATIVDELRSVN